MAKKRFRKKSCGNKIKHETIEDATKVLGIISEKWDVKDWNVYFCKFCSKFHIGRKSKNV